MGQAPHIPPASGPLANQMVEAGGHFADASSSAALSGTSWLVFMLERPEATEGFVSCGQAMDLLSQAFGAAAEVGAAVHGPVGLKLRADLRTVRDRLSDLAPALFSAGSQIESAGFQMVHGMDPSAGLGVVSAGRALAEMQGSMTDGALALGTLGGTGEPGETG